MRLLNGETLRSAIDHADVSAPTEFIKSLGLPQAKGSSLNGDWERELQTRLLLYGIILKGNLSAFPPAVIQELQRNELTCLTVLLYVQHRLGARQSLEMTLTEIAQRSPENAFEPMRAFIADLVYQTILDGSVAEDVVEQMKDLFASNEEHLRLFSIARIIDEFDLNNPPAAIAELRDLSKVTDAIGSAALLLLSRIYRALANPYEEKEVLSLWKKSLVDLSGKSLAEYAAKLSKTNSALTRTILGGAKRFCDLLEAAGSPADVDEIAKDFRKGGFTDGFPAESRRRKRESGCEVTLISRADVGSRRNLQMLLADILLKSARRNACVVVRDELGGEIDSIAAPSFAVDDPGITSRLATALASASIDVHPEIVEEGALEKRKWIVCYDRSKPIDAIAIGILVVPPNCSLTFARAILFETQLDSQKGDAWFREAEGILGRQFDQQKGTVVKNAMRDVIAQLSTGQSAVRVQEL